MTTMEILQLCVGSGLLALLWKIQKQLGEINTSLGFLKEGFDDHEQRLRRLE